jgi:hypothetical protein
MVKLIELHNSVCFAYLHKSFCFPLKQSLFVKNKNSDYSSNQQRSIEKDEENNYTIVTIILVVSFLQICTHSLMIHRLRVSKGGV